MFYLFSPYADAFSCLRIDALFQECKIPFWFDYYISSMNWTRFSSQTTQPAVNVNCWCILLTHSDYIYQLWLRVQLFDFSVKFMREKKNAFWMSCFDFEWEAWPMNFKWKCIHGIDAHLRRHKNDEHFNYSILKRFNSKWIFVHNHTVNATSSTAETIRKFHFHFSFSLLRSFVDHEFYQTDLMDPFHHSNP